MPSACRTSVFKARQMGHDLVETTEKRLRPKMRKASCVMKDIGKVCGGRPHHLARGQSPRCIPEVLVFPKVACSRYDTG